MRVIVESPFAGGFANVKFSREAIRDCLGRGESPFASHLLYTQKGILDDTLPDDRRRGIDAAVGWLEVADYIAVYMDLGITPGMLIGICRAAALHKPIHLRWIRGERREQVIEYESYSYPRANSTVDAREPNGPPLDLQRLGLLRDDGGP